MGRLFLLRSSGFGLRSSDSDLRASVSVSGLRLQVPATCHLPPATGCLQPASQAPATSQGPASSVFSICLQHLSSVSVFGLRLRTPSPVSGLRTPSPVSVFGLPPASLPDACLLPAARSENQKKIKRYYTPTGW